ncbi:hypothetical protein SPONL_1687 [uncultured Candidatus Thioglobus sp.]|nr:hypothetical protein SPONL_1687 [uncultured Candidatus Thioglobus sp.]
MGSTPLTVDVAPEMMLYKVLQGQSYGEEAALSEFVDNSIQSFIDNKDAIIKKDLTQNFIIDIKIDTKSQTITIEDNAGGIHRDNLQQAITMGRDSNNPHQNNSLSVYGMGLKSSAIWFSSQWKLETSCIDSNEKLSFVFDLDNLLASNSSEVKVDIQEEEESKHYTKITLLNHFRKSNLDFYQNVVLPFLSETFFRFKDVKVNIIHDDVVILTDEKKMFTPYNPLNARKFNKHGEIEDINSELITWEKNIDFDVDGRSVHGFVRIMNKGSYGQPAIRLLRNQRVIQGTSLNPNLPESITATKNKYGAQRIYGEIHLDQFSVNYQKTGFNEDLSGVYSKIKEILINENDLIQQAGNYRVNPKNTKKSQTGKIDSDKHNSSQSPENNNTYSEKLKTLSKIDKSNKLSQALRRVQNNKLPKLYKSLCTVSLREHSVLMYVGSWSFLESLSTLMGKPDTTPLDSYLNNKVNDFYTDRGKKNDIKGVISDIHKKGNSIKHSGNRTIVNGEQLHNDFEVLEEFLIHCLNEL